MEAEVRSRQVVGQERSEGDIRRAAEAVVKAAAVCYAGRTGQAISKEVQGLLVEAVIHNPAITGRLFDNLFIGQFACSLQ